MENVMSAERFDELAKGLADGTMPRRRALRLFGTALVGAAMASIPGTRWAWSQQNPCPGGCPPGRYCCPNRLTGGGTPTGGKCIPIQQTCASAACPNPGDVRCGGACTNVLTDVNNCGTCGNACSGGQICSEGQCVTAGCTAGTQGCGSCVNSLGENQLCECSNRADGSGTFC